MRTLFVTLFSLFTITAIAQSPVHLSKTISEKDGIYTLTVKATIDNGWHIYDAQHPYNPTTLKFEAGKGVELVGDVRALSTPKQISDDIFGNYGEYEGNAIFEQEVKLTDTSATVKAIFTYQACTEGQCTAPEEEELVFEIGSTATPAEASAEIAPVKDAAGSGSLWALIIEAVLWGFAALLTPCVFPMVPMTVSFFMKGSSTPAKGRLNASLYGLFIVLLYTLPIAAIIIITRIVGGDAVTADIFNWLATHWLPNIIFFIVFMVFAASFLGAFEITLPSWLVNKSDAASDKSGVAGIFFMALTLVLVSFSCTGPIVGSVLIKSTSGEFWSPILTMLAFSLAFALPFTIFAFFPSILTKLPKSGGWLN
ncbi:MAG: thiol:disulfide interchange protein, partial [Alistipes sp.]|nr:thiol:disulfide interchange protein [Alistipes sp.]